MVCVYDMFKKLKKRLEVEEGQPTFLGKPGTAVRSSINDSSSSVHVESVVTSRTEQQHSSNETDNGESCTNLDDSNTVNSQELKEVSQFRTTTQRDGMYVCVCNCSMDKFVSHVVLRASQFTKFFIRRMCCS